MGAPITNWFSANNIPGLDTYLRVYLLDVPFRHRADYEHHSPMTFIQNCKTPSLIFHGAEDPLGSQSWEFYNGLKMLGVPTELVVYPRENHGPTEGRAHEVDVWRRVLAWYSKYVKGIGS